MIRQFVVSAACASLLAAGLAAQQATFRSKTELIIVDAVVVDKAGNAVRGLKRTDFALTDRKKPQVIETFEEVSHQRPRSSSDGLFALPPTLKLDVASNVTVQADRLVMVIIDDLRIYRGRTDKARALAHDIVTRLGSQASMAVLFTSREGSTQVTQDRSSLLSAIDGMRGRRPYPRPIPGPTSQKLPRVNTSAPIEVTLDAINTASRNSLQDLFESTQYQSTLDDAARLLFEEDRRRKAFVLISEGMDADLSRIAGGGSDTTQVMGASVDAFSSSRSDLDGSTPLEADPAGISQDAMFNALRRANVALYIIDPRGKVDSGDMLRESWPEPDCLVCANPPTLPMNQERVRPREDSQFSWNNPVRKAQRGLSLTAQAAGGFAVTDTDDLTGGLGRILEDLDHYYLLGFYPSDTSGGNEMHPVNLTVPGHPDYSVRFRRGYTPDAPTRPLKSKDPLAELATGVMPRSDLPLRLTAMPLPGTGKEVSVAVALEVTAPVSSMKDADKKLRDDITYSVMAVDDRHAKVRHRTGRSASFSLVAADPTKEEPDHVTYQIPLLMDLAPGRYQLRASAMSRKLGTGGSVYLDVTVPDFSKAPLALTRIALGYEGGARVPVGRTTQAGLAMPSGSGNTRGAPMGQSVTMAPHTIIPGPVVPPAQARAQNSKNPLPFEPTLSREFSPSDVLRTYFEVARTDRTTSVALEIRMIDSSGVPQLRYDRIVAPGDPGGVHLRIPLLSLRPGAYTIRITSSDGRNRAATESGLIVR